MQTKFLMDGWDKETWENNCLNLAGITCNPANLTVSPNVLAEACKDKLLFMQVPHDGRAIDYIESLDKNIIWKVPAHPQFTADVMAIKSLGRKICTTMVYTLPQVMLALQWEAEYTILLFHKNPSQIFQQRAMKALGKSGVRHLIDDHGGMYVQDNIKTVGGSFRTLAEVEKAISLRLDYVTLRPETYNELWEHPPYKEEYEKYYGE
jgi:transaldolase